MRRFGDIEIQNIIKVVEEGKLSPFYQNPLGGEWVQAFEKDFAEYHVMPYAIAVSSGTTALHTSLLSLGVGEGDEVIVPPLTFVATVSAILMVGATPVFCDVEEETYNLDPEKLEECITEKTRVVIPVHLLGAPCDMNKIMKITSQYGLKVVEDCAQSLGAGIGERLTGTFGHLSTFSFQDTKTITTLGEGGMILTRISSYAECCRAIRNHAEKYFKAPYLGYNFRMTEAQAAFGLAQMMKVNYFNTLQRSNARYIIDHLPNGVNPPKYRERDTPTFFIVGCTLDDELVPKRDIIIEELTRREVNKNQPGATIGKGYSELVCDLPLFKKYKADVPVTRSLLQKFLWFDIHRWKDIKEVEKDMEIVNEVVNNV